MRAGVPWREGNAISMKTDETKGEFVKMMAITYKRRAQ